MGTDRSRPYEFVCDIARGGMASVALVVRREAGFTRAYAEKRLLPAFADDPDLRAMFMDEARIAGLLRHPNVVSVVDVGEDERGAFLLMEYVEGVPLTALIRRFAQVGEPTPLQICLDIVAQAARGLHAAHTLIDHDGSHLELVHRDVSPHNILVGFNGIVRVADFGIARALGRRTRTSTGILKGKIGYMAPEMLRFEPIDRRADLFSLGVVLYELVAGTRLYRSRDQTECARRILHEAPPDLGLSRVGVPDELVRLCFELLAKEPAHRPATAKDVARRLDAIRLDLAAVEGEHELEAFMREHLDESEVRERRTSIRDLGRRAAAAPAASTARPRAWSRRFLGVALLLVGVVVGIGVALASGALDAENESSEPDEPEVAGVSEPPESEPEVAEQEASPEPAGEAAPAAPNLDGSSDRGRTRRLRPRARPARHGARMTAAAPAVPVIDQY